MTHPTPGTADLLARARAWPADDPDPQTRAELEPVLMDAEAGGDAADLADRFAGTLEFGTAGLRGALGAGPEPDEPGRRDPRRGRPGGVPPRRRARPAARS